MTDRKFQVAGYKSQVTGCRLNKQQIVCTNYKQQNHKRQTIKACNLLLPAIHRHICLINFNFS